MVEEVGIRRGGVFVRAEHARGVCNVRDQWRFGVVTMSLRI